MNPMLRDLGDALRKTAGAILWFGFIVVTLSLFVFGVTGFTDRGWGTRLQSLLGLPVQVDGEWEAVASHLADFTRRVPSTEEWYARDGLFRYPPVPSKDSVDVVPWIEAQVGVVILKKDSRVLDPGRILGGDGVYSVTDDYVMITNSLGTKKFFIFRHEGQVRLHWGEPGNSVTLYPPGFDRKKFSLEFARETQALEDSVDAMMAADSTTTEPDLLPDDSSLSHPSTP